MSIENLIQNSLDEGDEFVRASDFKRGLACYLAQADNDSTGRCYANASLAAFKLADLANSEVYARRAIEQNSKRIEAYLNLSAALASNGRCDEAIEVCHKGLSLDPGNAQLWANLGGAQSKIGEYEAADRSLSKALELDPTHGFAALNRGNALRGLLRFDEAEACYLRAHELDSSTNDVLWNLSILYLLQGKFDKGLPLYEARWSTSTKHSDRLPSPKPWVDPHNYYNRILVWPEQGIGDEVMFASHFGFLHILSRETTVIADERLLNLFRRSFPTFSFLPKVGVIDHGSYDAHMPIGSLPLLRHQLSVSQNWFGRPFLIPSPNQRAATRPTGKQRIGLSWRSSNDKTRSDRTIALGQLLSALSPNSHHPVNLQYGESDLEFSQACERGGFSYDATRDVDKFNDIDALSSVIASCDCTITIDNSTAHLAGALGARTFVLLPYSPDWRWGCESESSLWYDSVRLIRQTARRDWQAPLDRLRQLLNK